MRAHTPLNLPWSSGHQVQLRTENRSVDAADSQTLALVALNLLSSRQATFRICASNLIGGSKLVPLITSM